MPKARMQARNDVVWHGLTIAQTARKYGVHRSTVWRWVKRARIMRLSGNTYIWTQSSRPHYHPRQIRQAIVDQVVSLREETGRCAQVIWVQLAREGISVSLSSVKRIIKKYRLARKKKRHIKTDTRFRRPPADKPGAFVEVDTIHFVTPIYRRFYI
jgi:IS30 family transposase